MKKIFIALVSVITMCCTANAADAKDVRCSNDSVKVNNQIILVENPIDNHKNIISFYDIDRLVIKNPKHSRVYVYDEQWNLIYTTTEEMIDLKLPAGVYYVESRAPLKQSYIFLS